jgi:hypothetical protein
MCSLWWGGKAGVKIVGMSKVVVEVSKSEDEAVLDDVDRRGVFGKMIFQFSHL